MPRYRVTVYQTRTIESHATVEIDALTEANATEEARDLVTYGELDGWIDTDTTDRKFSYVAEEIGDVIQH